MGFSLIFAFLRAKDAKLCLCNLGKKWPTASSVDHNRRLASFPQSQPLRRTLNAKIFPWKCYLCIIDVPFMQRKFTEVVGNARNIVLFGETHNSGAPYLHLREFHVISHCCDSRLFIMLLMTIPRTSLCAKPLTTIMYFVLYQIVDILSIHYVLFCIVKTNSFT